MIKSSKTIHTGIGKADTKKAAISRKRMDAKNVPTFYIIDLAYKVHKTHLMSYQQNNPTINNSDGIDVASPYRVVEINTPPDWNTNE